MGIFESACPAAVGMTIQDDRTAEERKTHTWIVVGTDSFMSGWGKASGGVSYAAWACKGSDVDRVENWVRARSDMKRVRIVSGRWCPRGNGHAHIYVVHDDHNALKGWQL